ncbi:late embryogenesis abundant protein Lea5-D-like [Miscanthus floridulus]|uniref:late embryogenesis abundant protein Lea5-D-like n=1 Tax=Miscanthus floridulus TaxID=154761 RepID=UPI0034580AB6
MSSKIGSVVSGLVSRRSYSGVYARAVTVQQSSAAAAVATAKTDVAVADASRATTKQDKFWMRDPKTGCWVPENRFEEVDVVELRNRMIHRK